MLRMMLLTVLLCLPSIAIGQAVAASAQTDADTQAIQKIEEDFIKAENTTDVAVLERTLADDYVNLTPRGFGPGKAEIIQGMQPHAGHAPPYSVEMSDMHIYILGETAIAAYTRTYTAKENGNVAKEDTTHVFVGDHSAWKLKISRTSIRGGE